MTHNQATEFIFKANESDLTNLLEAIALRRAQLGVLSKWTLKVGDRVKFTSVRKRSQCSYVGKVTDKRNTRATVRIEGPTYGKYPVGSLVTVPFNMLTQA